MKALILGLIFLFISLIGFKLGEKYKQKERFYYEFKNFLIYLKSEIGFFEKDIVEIVSTYSSKNQHLSELLNSFKQSLLGEKFEGLKILSEEENFKIIEFLNGLGKSDCESQKEYIEKNLEIFTNFYVEAKDKNLKQGTMCKKLSILVGVLVCILLI